jgi:hypothetical protein
VKEKIQREKEILREQRREEEEQKKQEEKERLLRMKPTKHKEKAGGGEPKDEETKKRQDTVRKVGNYSDASLVTLGSQTAEYGSNCPQFICKLASMQISFEAYVHNLL